jgi:hypothetical protein
MNIKDLPFIASILFKPIKRYLKRLFLWFCYGEEELFAFVNGRREDKESVKCN